MANLTWIEREQYESRLKGWSDYQTNLIGRNQILEEGRLEAKRESDILTIRELESFLQKPETPIDQLSGLSSEELTRIKKCLFEEIRNFKQTN